MQRQPFSPGSLSFSCRYAKLKSSPRSNGSCQYASFQFSKKAAPGVPSTSKVSVKGNSCRQSLATSGSFLSVVASASSCLRSRGVVAIERCRGPPKAPFDEVDAVIIDGEATEVLSPVRMRELGEASKPSGLPVCPSVCTFCLCNLSECSKKCKIPSALGQYPANFRSEYRVESYRLTAATAMSGLANRTSTLSWIMAVKSAVTLNVHSEDKCSLSHSDSKID